MTNARQLSGQADQRARSRQATQGVLWYPEAATALRDLAALPGNRFEKLRGDREGQYGIRVNDQWRICFVWKDGAEDVEIVDYHR